jgi:hypothetical protein
MSPTGQESPSSNALDALHARLRRPGERGEPRLAAVNELPVAQVPKPTPVRPASSDRLEDIVSEFVHHEPEVAPEPEDLRRDGMRRVLITGVIGLAAAVIVTSVGALLFGTFFPKEKGALQSFAAAAPPPAPQVQPADDASKLAQFRGLLAPNGGSQAPSQAATQSSSPEQSERLLQQFEQWRQKAASTDKP